MNQENSQTNGQENGVQNSTKQGNVKKCPVCGAIVMAYQAKCDDCGYEFRGVDANKSSQILAAKLAELEKCGYDWMDLDEKQAQLVRTFPIPATKEDLIEFSTSMLRQDPFGSELKSAFKAKASEAIMKLQILFPNDPAVLIVLKEQEAKKEEEKQAWAMAGKMWVIVLALALILAMILLILKMIVSISK